MQLLTIFLTASPACINPILCQGKPPIAPSVWLTILRIAVFPNSSIEERQLEQNDRGQNDRGQSDHPDGSNSTSNPDTASESNG